MTTIPVYETRYVSASETAKHLRAALKRAFPATKFSVRTKSYSGGASVMVEWTDGPSAKVVEEVTAAFEGKGFDGMIDMQYNIDAWVLNGEILGTCSRGTGGSRGSVAAWGMIPPHDDAERVHFGCYVSTSRHVSPTLANRCIRQIAAYWGGVAEPLPTAIPSRYGKGYDLPNGQGSAKIRADLGYSHDWYTMIHQAAEDRTRFQISR